jgi:hypothetical protein
VRWRCDGMRRRTLLWTPGCRWCTSSSQHVNAHQRTPLQQVDAHCQHTPWTLTVLDARRWRTPTQHVDARRSILSTHTADERQTMPLMCCDCVCRRAAIIPSSTTVCVDNGTNHTHAATSQSWSSARTCTPFFSSVTISFFFFYCFSLQNSHFVSPLLDNSTILLKMILWDWAIRPRRARPWLFPPTRDHALNPPTRDHALNPPTRDPVLNRAPHPHFPL